MPSKPSHASETTRRNVTRIAQLEADFEQQRTPVERFLARIASWTGSLQFLAFHFIGFIVWVYLNSASWMHKKFDPYPFEMLGVFVSCEAVLLSTIVLIEQNWIGRREERREHLHLQVNLLAEQEITKVLALQRLICQRLGIREAETDPEVAAFSQETAVENLAEQLEDEKSSGGG